MAEGEGFEVFFLPAEPGARFALFRPAQGPAVRGGILYVHPFAEEMNKSRRMVAQQARAFTQCGYAVLQIDLYGCGDSSGDFGDARWDIWKSDLALAAAWLADRVPGPFGIWGLRLGATLALDFWRDRPETFTSALLWQPVASGETFVTQFLRLAVAGEALRDGVHGVTTEGLRKRLLAGEAIEVAGYELAPPLVDAIDRQKLMDWTLPGATVSWLDVKSGSTSGPPPATQRILTSWQDKGIPVSYEAVVGDPFWLTQEIVEAPAVIQASIARYGLLAS